MDMLLTVVVEVVVVVGQAGVTVTVPVLPAFVVVTWMTYTLDVAW